MRLDSRVFAALTVLAAGGCEARLPPRWVEGGAATDLPRARWTRGERLIDVMTDGKVLADGEHILTLDRAGRVLEPDDEPIAVLQPDGHLVGKNDAPLGRIGVRNASAPGRDAAWISIGERGEVQRFDSDGEPRFDGVWTGCAAAVRTCTLTSHLIALVESRGARSGHAPGGGAGVGVGVGLGLVVSP